MPPKRSASSVSESDNDTVGTRVLEGKQEAARLARRANFRAVRELPYPRAQRFVRDMRQQIPRFASGVERARRTNQAARLERYMAGDDQAVDSQARSDARWHGVTMNMHRQRKAARAADAAGAPLPEVPAVPGAAAAAAPSASSVSSEHSYEDSSAAPRAAAARQPPFLNRLVANRRHGRTRLEREAQRRQQYETVVRPRRNAEIRANRLRPETASAQQGRAAGFRQTLARRHGIPVGDITTGLDRVVPDAAVAADARSEAGSARTPRGYKRVARAAGGDAFVTDDEASVHSGNTPAANHREKRREIIKATARNRRTREAAFRARAPNAAALFDDETGTSTEMARNPHLHEHAPRADRLPRLKRRRAEAGNSVVDSSDSKTSDESGSTGTSARNSSVGTAVSSTSSYDTVPSKSARTSTWSKSHRSRVPRVPGYHHKRGPPPPPPPPGGSGAGPAAAAAWPGSMFIGR